MTDFELALRNSIREAFPQCTLKGCWFHYTQAVVRKMRTVGLSGERDSNEEFKTWLGSVLVVPLLPAARITEAYDMLLRKDFGLSVTPFKEYINSFWKRMSPGELSVFRTVGRTNNPAEAYNRKLLRFLVGNSHPNYFHFLRQISESLKSSHLDFVRLTNGLSITRPMKKETISLNKHILRGWERFDRDQDIEHFFSSMKYNVARFTEAETAASDDDERDDAGDDDNNDDGVNIDGNSTEEPIVTNNENLDRCPICLLNINEDRWAFVPCGHSPFCQSCSSTVLDNVYEIRTRQVDRQVRCPVCRQPVTSRLRLFTH